MDLAVLAPNVVFSHPSSSCVFQLLVSILKFEACQMWGLLYFFSYFLFCFFGMFRKTNKKVLGSHFVGMFFCFICIFFKESSDPVNWSCGSEGLPFFQPANPGKNYGNITWAPPRSQGGSCLGYSYWYMGRSTRIILRGWWYDWKQDEMTIQSSLGSSKHWKIALWVIFAAPGLNE